MPKKNLRILAVERNFKKPKIPLLELSINWFDQVKFDQVIKYNFDQTPKLLETFDQLIRSSEIRSSDPLSCYCNWDECKKKNYCNVLKVKRIINFFSDEVQQKRTNENYNRQIRVLFSKFVKQKIRNFD